MTEIAEVVKTKGNVGALLGRSFYFEFTSERPNNPSDSGGRIKDWK